MYTIKNTEQTRKKASEFETKSMLYLIGMRSDKNEIEFLFIDCFNDVTGSNDTISKMWDVQSKNYSTFSPSTIGKCLFTLYDNYISDIDFSEYILFITPLKSEYLEDEKQKIYSFENVADKTQKRVRKSLIKEINRRNNTSVKKPTLLEDFLSKVIFVTDNKRISTYIKSLSNFKNKRIVDEPFYNSIFNEIRDIQSSLKNSMIENTVINEAKDVLKLNRHLTKKNISTLVISRLVGVDVFSFPGIPPDFIQETQDLDPEEIKDLIQDCNSNLSRAFFNKNDCKSFWKISEYIFEHFKANTGSSIYEVFNLLNQKIRYKTLYLDKQTVLYMISLVKYGFENEN